MHSPIDAPHEPCTRVRSTLLQGSLRALRERGHGEAYLQHAPPEVVAAILAVGAPQWMPIATAEAHYQACDALALSVDEMLKMGASVAPTAASGVRVILHAARTTGATPWTALDNAPTYWKRMYEGSSLSVRKTGPKDAAIVVRGTPLARYAYWRIGLRGIIGELGGALALKAIARETSSSMARDTVSYSLSWV